MNIKIKHVLKHKSHQLKKSLTNELHTQILEIIGLGKEALSANEIVQRSLKEHPSTTTKYTYEVIKELYRVDHLGQPHAERFLKISYGESAKGEISNIEATEKDDWIRPARIAQITNNPRNWRYRLNYKGLLLYLIAVHQAHQVNRRTINTMIRNLSSYSDFEFLQYFDVFEKEKVDLLLEIALELQFQLKTLTPEYLRNYILNRCYDEITIDLSILDNPLFRHLSNLSHIPKFRKTEQETNLILKLRNYKLKILNELMSSEQNRLKEMEQEKRSLSNTLNN
jgi:hypothetical protein